MSEEAEVGFTWPRWAPVAYAGEPVGATGGDEARFGSVPGRMPVRVASP
jgi:hypothetical protein